MVAFITGFLTEALIWCVVFCLAIVSKKAKVHKE